MMNPTLARAASISNLIGRVHQGTTALFVCDVQERFRPHIHAFPSVVHVANTLMKAATVFKMPILVTEQRPSALGSTVPELDVKGASVFSKNLFSMCTAELLKALPPHVESVVLCGIEAHVCVLQTAIDLVDKGLDVHLVMDGVSSIRQHDRLGAFVRMKELGVFLTTSESILFQIMKDATHPDFKVISSLAKEHAQAKVDPMLPVAAL